VIGAINGAAVGVGASLTLPMDIRLSSTYGKFGFVYVRRGIVAEGASSWFLPRIVGIGTAMEWVATGKLVVADEARRAGLVRSVHTPGALLPAARSIAQEIVEHTAPVSVALSRRLLWEMAGEPHPMAAHRADSRAIAARRVSGDAAEGVSAFFDQFAMVDSVPGSDVVTAGSVHFTTARDGRSTQVSVHLQYAPPAGKAGSLIASLFGREPSQTIREDLRHFKQLLEAGEIPRSTA